MKILRFLPAVLLPVPSVLFGQDSAEIIFAGETYAAQRAGLTADHVFENLWGQTGNAFPFETVTGNTWRYSGWGAWPSGFYAGIFWHYADLTGEALWADRARAYTNALSGWQTKAGDHDIGFNLLTSFGRAFSVEGAVSDRLALVTGANTFSNEHWMPVVGSLWSFNFNWSARIRPDNSERIQGPIRPRQNVIIDTAMNIELLFQGARYSADTLLWDRGLSHMRNVVRDMIREDGGNIQVVDYWLSDQFAEGELVAPAGSVRGAYAWQGFSNESSWSRGQGWAIHGLASAYRETGDPTIFEGLLRAADYYIRETPEDGIPYWDYDGAKLDPSDWVGTGWNGGNFLARDSSAAAIAAAGLLELSRLLDDTCLRQHYFEYAEHILASLSTPEGEGGYLSIETDYESILTKGTYNFPGDRKGLAWGDFYYIQALQRYREIVDPFPAFGAHPATAQTARWGALPAHAWTVRSHAGQRALGTVHGIYADGVAGRPQAVALHDEPVNGDFSFAVDFVSDENQALRPDASALIVFDWQGEEAHHFLLFSAAANTSGIYRVDGGDPVRVVALADPLIDGHAWQRAVLARNGNAYTVSLDGALLFDGVYSGAPGSGLVGVGSLGHSSFFASPELILPHAAPATFAAWAETNIADPANRLPEVDANGNGLANLLDYVLGGGDGSGLSVVYAGDNGIEALYPSRSRADVDLVLEYSEDLISWHPVRTGSPLQHLPGPDGRRTVSYEAPVGGFFRLRAEVRP